MSTSTPKGRRFAVLVALSLVAGLMAVSSPASAATGDVESRPVYSACVDGATASAGFTDVPAGAFYAAAANCMKYYGVTAGKTATTYAPNEVLPRWQMAIFLAKVADLAGHTLSSGATGPFTDLTGVSDAGVKAINQIYDLGLTSGKSATTFAPFDTVTRWEMAIFIETLLGKSAAGPGGQTNPAISATLINGDGSSASGFTDLGNVTSRAEKAIEEIYDLAVTAGKGSATTFKPFDKVNRGEMAVFLAAAMKHTNIRPAGTSLQVDKTSNTGGFTANLAVSQRDSAFRPVANARIDVFEYEYLSSTTPKAVLKADGTCDTDVTVPVNNTSECTISTDDGVTNALGNRTFTNTVADSSTNTWWAWTGALGAQFDIDTVTPGSATSVTSAGIDAVDVSWNLPKNALVVGGRTTAKFGTVTYTLQLVDADDDPVAAANVEILYDYTLVSGTSTTSLSGQKLTTDANGMATVSFTVADPSTTIGNTATLDIAFTYAPGVIYDMADKDVAMEDQLPDAKTVTVVSGNDYVVASDTGVGAGNTATATVYDQYGIGIAGESVVFTTDDAASGAAATLFSTTDGTAVNAYARDATTTSFETVTATVAGLTPATDSVYWVKKDAPSATYGPGVVVNLVDKTNNTVVVTVAADFWIFTWDAGDQLQIAGAAKTEAQFEDGFTTAKTLTINWVLNGNSVFNRTP